MMQSRKSESIILPLLLLTSLSLTALSGQSLASDDRTLIVQQPNFAKPRIDFRYPERQYRLRSFGSINAYVEDQLLRDDPQTANLALRRLDEKSNEALLQFPPATRDELRALPFFLL